VTEARRANPGRSFEASLKARIAAFGGEEGLPWIYLNDIEDVWEKYVGDRTQSNGAA